MLPCHSCYICGTRGAKRHGFFKVIIWREGEKPQTSRETFLGRQEKTTQEVDH